MWHGARNGVRIMTASSRVIRRIVSLAVAASAVAVSTVAVASEPEMASPEQVEEAPVEEAPVEETAPTAAPVELEMASSVSMSPAPVDVDRPASGRSERLRIGALAGVGFPRPLSIEAFAKVDRIVGLGVEYSFLPRTSLGGAEVGFKGIAADLRVFPFKNSFFIGARIGRQWLDAQATLGQGQAGSFTESMEAATWFVNPRIGVLHTFKGGVTVGMDAGVQIPVGASYSRAGRATDAGIKTDADPMLETVAAVLGNKTTPTVDLLRVGFLF